MTSTANWALYIAIWGYVPEEYGNGSNDVVLLLGGMLTGALLASLIAGLPIDRFGPRRVLIAVEILAALIALATIPLLSTHMLLVALCSFTMGMASTAAVPAFQACVPLLCGPSDYLRTNAIVEVANSQAIVTGPLLATACATTLGTQSTFFFAAVLHLLAASTARRLPSHDANTTRTTPGAAPDTAKTDRQNPTKPTALTQEHAGNSAKKDHTRQESAPESSTQYAHLPQDASGATQDDLPAEYDSEEASLREVLAGFSFAWRTRPVRRIFLLTGTTYALWGAYEILEPVYVITFLDRSPDVLSLLQAVLGISMLATNLLISRSLVPASLQKSSFRVLGAATAIGGLCAALYTGTDLLWVAVSGVFLWGISVAFFETSRITLLQEETPQELHGRILSSSLLLDTGMGIVMIPLTWTLIRAAGLHPAVFLISGFTAAIGLLAWARRPNTKTDRPTGTPHLAQIPLPEGSSTQ